MSTAKTFSKAPYRRRVISEVKPAILSASATELEAWLSSRAAPAYRRKQVWGWLARGAASFDEMRDVPKPLRSGLEADFRITSLRPVAVSQADRGLTTKTLYELDGGHSVEAVVMRSAYRRKRAARSVALSAPPASFRLVATSRPTRSSSSRLTLSACSLPKAGACRTSSSWAWASRWPTTRR